MAIAAVTTAIVEHLRASLGRRAGLPPTSFSVSIGSPSGDMPSADLVLFLYLITPSPELRNADRIRPFPQASDPPRLMEPAVPLDLHYLVTTGKPAPEGLSRLSGAIAALEAASPLAVPAAFQAAVWLSLLPMTTDEMSQLWGLFPNEDCSASFAFRASPVWIDPLEPAAIGPPVIDDGVVAGRLAEAA